MASTHGRKRLPVPPSLRDGLRALGFFEAQTTEGPYQYRLPAFPAVKVALVASSIPGDTAVIYQRETGGPKRLEADAVLVDVAIDIARLHSPDRRT